MTMRQHFKLKYTQTHFQGYGKNKTKKQKTKPLDYKLKIKIRKKKEMRKDGLNLVKKQKALKKLFQK